MKFLIDKNIILKIKILKKIIKTLKFKILNKYVKIIYLKNIDVKKNFTT